MTAPIGLRPGRESLETKLLVRDLFSLRAVLQDYREEECLRQPMLERAYKEYHSNEIFATTVTFDPLLP
jgi:hypothetical protein